MTNKKNSIKCNKIDHYTLIVPNAKSVSDFHKNVLGYPFLQIKEVNAGSAPQGKFDMINYIHEWPDNSGRILVVTEGLTDESIFRRFMTKYGQGIHHVALQVDDLDSTCEILNQKGIKRTSPDIMIDFLSGLKQVFIDNSDTGVFIELIERKKIDHAQTDATEKGFFTHDNMAGLAGSMSNYVENTVKVKTTKEEKIKTEKTIGKILNIALREFILEVPSPEKTAIFFEETFGFKRATQNSNGHIRIYLQADPTLFFLLKKKTDDLAHHSLICQGKLSDDFKVGLEKHTNTYMEMEDKKLKINAALTGYPLSIIARA